MCDNCCTPFIEGEGCASALQKRASNVASGDYSIATGHGTIASNEGEMSTGTYNKPNDGQVFSVGVGTSDSNRMNAIQVNKDGSTSFLYNGRIVKLADLIRNVSPSGEIILDVQGGYIVVSYDGGQTYHNLIAISELKGDPGITSVTAQIDSSTQELGVRATLSDGVLTLIFSGLQGGGGTSNVVALNDLTDVTIASASNGQALVYRNGVWRNETIEGGDTPIPSDPVEPGRSITGVQHWFKLCASESVQATPMNVADPSSSAGGSWSLTAGSPSVQYPYLRCFMQVNYDQPLASGYTYTRSSAFTARYFNSESSVQFDELVDAISSLRSDLLTEVADREAAITALNTALEGLRSTISGSVANQIDELRNRLNQISGTDVELIMNNGLWAVLTSWQSDTGNKKAFADILLQAENAKAQLQTGSTFFDRTVGGSITLDGILGQINAKVTRQDVNAMIASAQFSVDPSSLNSVISKSQACWRKNGILYPYDLYLTDYMTANPSATLADYETYMTAQSGGPSGDSNRPAGPFELVVVVEQFSSIKQTVDEISASVDTTKYMWQKGNQYASYNAFETNYENRSSDYSLYTYEQYVTSVLGYTKVEVGAALSNITQTSDEIKSQLGDMGYFWRRSTVGGGYEYQRYAVPANTTRDDYVDDMEDAGWELITYASRMSVIDQFPDSITALVKKSTLCWVDENATGAAYCRDYDYWMDEYLEFEGAEQPYEEYVGEQHPTYVLTVVTDSFSRIKQTANSISSTVTELGELDARMTAIEQTSDGISLSVSKGQYCWVENEDETLHRYDYFMVDYETYKASAINPLDYEDWVENTQNCTLSDSFEEVSGIKLKGDRIWAGVGDGDDLKASIEIIADAETDEGKIILDADNVIINGGLQAGVVKAGTIDARAVTTEKLDTNAVTAGKIDAGAVTTEKLAAGAVTAGKIDAGAITTDKLAANAVTAGKIDAGAVTTDKLDANSVTAAKIATGAITADKISAGEVTAEKIAAGAITADKIDTGAITTDKLAALAVTAAKIAAGAITAEKIATGVLEAAFASILEQLTVGENSNIVLEDGLIKFYDSNNILRMQLGQGEGDDNPVLWFYDANGNPLYNLGPGGFIRNGYINPPSWNNLLFYYSSTPFSTSGSGVNLRSLTPVSIYQYGDAYRIYYNVDASQGYRVPLSPFNINTEMVQNSSMNGHYFDQYFMPTQSNYASHFVPDGYYIICGPWTPVSGDPNTYQNYGTGHSWEEVMAFSIQDGHLQNKYECKIVETINGSDVALNVKQFSVMITPD